MMKHDMARYDSYKDSGVEWLGDVPKHWEVLPLKDLAAKSTGSFVDGPFGSDLKSNEYTDLGVPLIQLNNIGIGFHSTKDLKFISEEKAISLSKHRAFPGEIAIAKMADPVARATVISNVYPMYVIVADCMKFKPNSHISDKNYIAYALNTIHVKSQAEVLSNGTTRIRINLGTTKILKVVTPPLPEQKAIADYLDTKTDHIDQKIGLLTQKTTQYGKLKQSLINETVTRGLDKSVAMKDSGVEWFGDVPTHWSVRRIKEISEINKRTLSEKTSASYEFNYVDIGSVTYGGKGFTTERMTFDIAPSRAKRIVKKGDTIISTVRTYLKAITSIDDDVSDLIVSTGFAVISPKKGFVNKYYSYLLTSDFIVNKICALSTGVSYPATNSSVIGDLFCLVPPLPEQKAIADYLDIKTAHIDRVVETINNQIDKLKELRKTLINDVVTGKIRVVTKGEVNE